MTTTAQLAQCITDDRGIIVAADPAYLEILGRLRHEVVGRSPLEFTAACDRGINTALLGRLARHGQAFSITKRYVRGDGGVQWVSIHASALREEGAATRFVATCRPHREPNAAGSILRTRRDATRLADMVALAKLSFGGDLIGSPAFEMLLHLHLAELECRSRAPGCLAEAIGQSTSATIRWARVLVQRGLIERERDGEIAFDTPLRITGEAQRMIESIAAASHRRARGVR